MRDYPNGGFFFIDAAPIIAAGESGLKIDGIYEDAKRAIAGGKLLVVSDFPEDNGYLQGAISGFLNMDIANDEITIYCGTEQFASISNEDVITLVS